MEPLELMTQPGLLGELDAAHIRVELPVEDGTLPIGWSISVRDRTGLLIHQEAWSRGAFNSDLHCLITLALTLHRVLERSREGV